MSEPAVAAMERLRVAVYTSDPLRRSDLCRIVSEAGHRVVDMHDAPDVVLADGSRPLAEGRPLVALGGGDDDVAAALPRDASANQIDAAIRAVAAGLTVRLPGTREAGFSAMRETEGQALLTPRELEVLAALAGGMTNKAIARRLDISLHTVKFHVESLFRKLGARTRTEAVAKASERRRRETIVL
ncbi:MAG TPA: response regulator transcription factor [Bradyrhizobium sp.]|jgi:DNA-binding CsgD family transcriptional regulator|nr:response regulator transcription factor [Bradyrhizobium sp.]